MNFAQLQAEVFRRIDESSASPAYFSVADVKAAINDGYEELADAAEFHETHTTVKKLSHRTYYDMRAIPDHTFLRPSRCFNPTTNRWLEPVSVNDLDLRTYREWEGISVTEPEKMLMRGLWWWGVFPQAAEDGGFLRLYYIGIPAALTLDSDEPQFAKEFHAALVEYALYDLLAQDGETRLALDHWGKFMGYEQALRDSMQTRANLDLIRVIRG